MLIKKKENKELFEAVSFVQCARETRRNYAEGPLEHLKKIGDLLIAADGHRAHTAKTQQLDEDGLYDYHKKGSTIVLEVIEESRRAYPDILDTLKGFKFVVSVEISRGEFLHRLRQVNIVLDRQYKGVKFNFGGCKLVIEAVNPDVGDATTELDMAIGLELEIGFNCNYLIEALRGMQREKVMLSLPDSGDKPIKLEQGALEAFIMSMRI